MVALARVERHLQQLEDGTTVATSSKSAEIRDPGGRLLVRYADGVLEVEATADLRLKAPAGRVAIESRDGVEITTEGPLRMHAAEIDVEARRTRFVTGVAEVLARDLSVAAWRIAQRVERAELEATHLVSTTRFFVQEVRELAQRRFGRVRTQVDDEYDLAARRTQIDSREDTCIDGKRVLLG